MYVCTDCIFNHANAVRCIGTDAQNSSFLAIEIENRNPEIAGVLVTDFQDFGPLSDRSDFDKRTLVCER